MGWRVKLPLFTLNTLYATLHINPHNPITLITLITLITRNSNPNNRNKPINHIIFIIRWCTCPTGTGTVCSTNKLERISCCGFCRHSWLRDPYTTSRLTWKRAQKFIMIENVFFCPSCALLVSLCRVHFVCFVCVLVYIGNGYTVYIIMFVYLQTEKQPHSYTYTDSETRKHPLALLSYTHENHYSTQEHKERRGRGKKLTS
jgi:hypothetical protein